MSVTPFFRDAIGIHVQADRISYANLVSYLHATFGEKAANFYKQVRG
jgi:hypothetical protein